MYHAMQKSEVNPWELGELGVRPRVIKLGSQGFYSVGYPDSLVLDVHQHGISEH